MIMDTEVIYKLCQHSSDEYTDFLRKLVALYEDSYELYNENLRAELEKEIQYHINEINAHAVYYTEITTREHIHIWVDWIDDEYD